MAEHIIPITNGKGSKELANGNYNVAATVSGYDNSTITPSTEREINLTDANYEGLPIENGQLSFTEAE